MSKLTNVFYLLLVATATNAWDLLPAAQKSFDDAVDSSITRIRSDYEAAKIFVRILVSQIEFQGPQQSKASSDEENKEYIQRAYPFQMNSRQYEYPNPNVSPSAECREFLRKRMLTSMPQIIECSKGYLKLAKGQQDRLNETLVGALAKLAAQKDEAKSCETWYSGFFELNSQAASCYVNMKQKLSTTVEGAKAEFSAAIENAKKVVNTWVPDAGHCVALAENPMPEMEWFQACKNSIEPYDVGHPTRPEVVHI